MEKKELRGVLNYSVIRGATLLVGTILASAGTLCLPAYAQSGCAQASPENPSVVLALLGGGIAALSLIWARRRPH